MGLEKIGQKIAGVIVTPAIWAMNYVANGNRPDVVDIGLYAAGYFSAGASTGVSLLKSHVDDDMNQKLLSIQRKENPKWAPFIKNCYHFNYTLPPINAMTIAGLGGTTWKDLNGLWVYITDARGRMVKDFKPKSFVIMYQPKHPLIKRNGKFVVGVTR